MTVRLAVTAEQLVAAGNYTQIFAWGTAIAVLGIAAITRSKLTTAFTGMVGFCLSLTGMLLELMAYTPPSGELSQFSDRWMHHVPMLALNVPMYLFVLFIAAFIGFRPAVSGLFRRTFGVKEEDPSPVTATA